MWETGEWRDNLTGEINTPSAALPFSVCWSYKSNEKFCFWVYALVICSRINLLLLECHLFFRIHVQHRKLCTVDPSSAEALKLFFYQVKISSCFDGWAFIIIFPLLPSLFVTTSFCFSLSPPATWYQCQVIDGRVRLRLMGHASILKTCLINLLPYRVTEHTNFGPAENPLAILINLHTCMNEHTQWNTDGGGHGLAYTQMQIAQCESKTLKEHVKHTLKNKTNTHQDYSISFVNNVN